METKKLNILALDCATVTGWARIHNGVVTSGTFKLKSAPRESIGLVFYRFENELRRLCVRVPDVIAWELPHMRGQAASDVGVGLSTRIQQLVAVNNHKMNDHHIEEMPVQDCAIKKYAASCGVVFPKCNIVIVPAMKRKNGKLVPALDRKGQQKMRRKKICEAGRDAHKKVMFEGARDILGYNPVDDNEADALWLLRYAMDDLGVKSTEPKSR